jgi:hypothetical protein
VAWYFSAAGNTKWIPWSVTGWSMVDGSSCGTVVAAVGAVGVIDWSAFVHPDSNSTSAQNGRRDRIIGWTIRTLTTVPLVAPYL